MGERPPVQVDGAVRPGDRHPDGAPAVGNALRRARVRRPRAAHRRGDPRPPLDYRGHRLREAASIVERRARVRGVRLARGVDYTAVPSSVPGHEGRTARLRPPQARQVHGLLPGGLRRGPGVHRMLVRPVHGLERAREGVLDQGRGVQRALRGTHSQLWTRRRGWPCRRGAGPFAGSCRSSWSYSPWHTNSPIS